MKSRRVGVALSWSVITLLLLAWWYLGSPLPALSTLEQPNLVTGSYVLDPGNISVLFCPREDCETALVQFIDTAQSTLHCALFEIDLPAIQLKLREKAKTIDVQIITDNDYLKDFNASFVKADTYGLMHNKFCIVDGTAVSTGSMNPTINDAHKNNNNLLFISSSAIAQNYEQEFQEMWQGMFKKGMATRSPAVLVGEIPIETYFCPDDHCARHVQEELGKAKESIFFMAFSFTHQGIADVLLLKSLENITIAGVMEARQVTKYSVYQQLSYQRLNVTKDGNPRNLHHKTFIIDRETVVTGSFNPTDGGDKRNDENVVIIKDKKLAAEFLEEFEKVWGEAENKMRNETDAPAGQPASIHQPS